MRLLMCEFVRNVDDDAIIWHGIGEVMRVKINQSQFHISKSNRGEMDGVHFGRDTMIITMMQTYDLF